MPSEDTKVLKFNQYHKSDKALFIIYADLECIIKITCIYKDSMKKFCEFFREHTVNIINFKQKK